MGELVPVAGMESMALLALLVIQHGTTQHNTTQCLYCSSPPKGLMVCGSPSGVNGQRGRDGKMGRPGQRGRDGKGGGGGKKGANGNKGTAGKNGADAGIIDVTLSGSRAALKVCATAAAVVISPWFAAAVVAHLEVRVVW